MESITPAGVHRRRRWVVGFGVLALGALAPGQWDLRRAPGDDTVASAESGQPSSRNARQVRGRILDRNGAPLADNRRGTRRYPHGALASHLIGYVDGAELVGRYGVEKALERTLHGGDDDVVLTLDLGLQKAAEKAVKDHAAAAVAVAEVETGRILALVSTPSFDPSAMTGDLAGAEQERLKNDPLRPLVDRTLQQPYPPASTFKLVTAVAGLESHMVSPHEELTCTGSRTVGNRVLYDMDVHGTIDFLEALQRSCNIYFWTIGERVGIDRLARVARDFGFGAPTGLGINGDVAGQVPDRAMFGGQADRDLVLTLNTAVGLEEVKATVVQLAMAYAALANGGRLYEPQVVRRVQTTRGKLVDDRPPILRRKVNASPATLELIRQGMTRAVNKRGGTAFAAKKGAVKMVGKTGTELHRHPADEAGTAGHAWFAGWAPSAHPKIVIVVLIENGGIGGTIAAPVAREIIDAYFTRPPVSRHSRPHRRAGRHRR